MNFSFVFVEWSASRCGKTFKTHFYFLSRAIIIRTATITAITLFCLTIITLKGKIYLLCEWMGVKFFVVVIKFSFCVRRWKKKRESERLACFSGFIYKICDKLRDKSLSGITTTSTALSLVESCESERERGEISSVNLTVLNGNQDYVNKFVQTFA